MFSLVLHRVMDILLSHCVDFLNAVIGALNMLRTSLQPSS